jgi:hypothetical protein
MEEPCEYKAKKGKYPLVFFDQTFFSEKKARKAILALVFSENILLDYIIIANWMSHSENLVVIGW